MKNTRPGLEAIEQGRYNRSALRVKIELLRKPDTQYLPGKGHDVQACLCAGCTLARINARRAK